MTFNRHYDEHARNRTEHGCVRGAVARRREALAHAIDLVTAANAAGLRTAAILYTDGETALYTPGIAMLHCRLFRDQHAARPNHGDTWREF